MEASRELIKAPELGREPVQVVTKKDIDEWIFGTGTKLTEQQKALFYKVAISCNLNPIKREVYAIPYGANFNIITGYEVYLKRAERTGLLEYWEATVKKEDNEYVGLCTIKRTDRTRPTTIEAWFNEYNQGNNMWKTKPRTMIRKVAIAQAFRMVFSEELGGMPYTSDEMGTAEPREVKAVSIEDATIQAGQDDKNLGALSDFDRLLAAKKVGKQKHLLENFINATAEANGVSADALKIRASQNFEKFWLAFEIWKGKQGATAPPTAPSPEAATQAHPEPEASAGGGVAPRAVTEDQIIAIIDGIREGKLSEDKICGDYDVSELAELTMDAAKNILTEAMKS